MNPYPREPLDRSGRRVTVANRSEVGKVLQWGANVGVPSQNVWAVIIRFEPSGEIAWYDANSVMLVPEA